MTDEKPVTGGCYCGAIRYEARGEPVHIGMCHCRMCQKWTGLAAAMGIFYPLDSLRFTKGHPKTFMTSKILQRSFCGDCGTLIGHRYVAGAFKQAMAIFIGTHDYPEDLAGPRAHYGVESHLKNWVQLDEDVPKLKAEGDPVLAEAWAAVGGAPEG